MEPRETQSAMESDSKRSEAPRSEAPRSERVVEQASRESFPASDPPAYTPARPGAAASRPDDVPLTPSTSESAESALTHEDARVWTTELVGAFDRCDAAAIGALLTEDAMVRIGSAPLLVGRAQAVEWLRGYLEALGHTAHHVTDVRVDGDAIFVEADVNVRTHDGAKLMRPEAISVRLREHLASRVTVYGAPSVTPR